jgi:hypothetical protein
VTRAFYRLLLWLHPRSFRDEFGGEMLWIFDQSSRDTAALFPDIVLSVARQWCLRSDVWKFALGALVSAALFAGMIGPAASRLAGH